MKGPIGAFIFMYLDPKNIKFCIDQVNQIAEQYNLVELGADNPQRSVDGLRDACEKFLRKKIFIKRLQIDKDKSPVLGAFFLLKDGNVDICIVEGLNHCWTRYVIGKEIFHLVIDKVEFRNMDLVPHVDEVTVKFPIKESIGSSAVEAELLATVAAMEFFFPYKRRLEELKGTNANNLKAIAEKYKVPEALIGLYLSNSYMDNLREYSQA
jgi:hypothetical protein